MSSSNRLIVHGNNHQAVQSQRRLDRIEQFGLGQGGVGLEANGVLAELLGRRRLAPGELPVKGDQAVHIWLRRWWRRAEDLSVELGVSLSDSLADGRGRRGQLGRREATGPRLEHRHLAGLNQGRSRLELRCAGLHPRGLWLLNDLHELSAIVHGRDAVHSQDRLEGVNYLLFCQRVLGTERDGRTRKGKRAENGAIAKLGVDGQNLVQVHPPKVNRTGTKPSSVPWLYSDAGQLLSQKRVAPTSAVAAFVSVGNCAVMEAGNAGRFEGRKTVLPVRRP